jgi:hypothetical protein
VKRLATAALATLAVCGSLAAGAVAPALAAPHTIQITVASQPLAGRPMSVQLSGVVAPPEEFWDLAWIEMVALPSNVVQGCPVSDGSGLAVAEGAGGQILAIALRPYTQPQGSYSNEVGWTPPAAGRYYLCAYLDDGEGLTLAGTELAVDVGAGSGKGPTGGGSRPVNLLRPRVTRAGRTLTCHAGRWENAGRYSYAWLFDGRHSKATGRQVSLTGDVRGHSAACRVKARGPDGTATAVSRPLRLH